MSSRHLLLFLQKLFLLFDKKFQKMDLLVSLRRSSEVLRKLIKAVAELLELQVRHDRAGFGSVQTFFSRNVASRSQQCFTDNFKKLIRWRENFFVYPFCFPVEWELERMRAPAAKGFSIRSRSTNFSLYFCFSFFASDLFPPKFFFFGTKLSVLVSTFTAFTFFLSLRVRFESILATVEAQLGRKSALEILSEWLVCVLKNFFCPHWNGPA